MGQFGNWTTDGFGDKLQEILGILPARYHALDGVTSET